MRRTKKNPAADAALPVIPAELIDQIVKGPMSADAALARICGESPNHTQTARNDTPGSNLPLVQARVDLGTALPEVALYLPTAECHPEP